MKSIIENFYRAFDNLDAESMIDCYHKDIKFEDPAFGVLKGEKAKNMWRMLCHSQKGKNFKVKASNIVYNNMKGTADWEAHYTFSKTGRRVHNVINAEFEFKDSKIIDILNSFEEDPIRRFERSISLIKMSKKEKNQFIITSTYVCDTLSNHFNLERKDLFKKIKRFLFH